MPNVKVNYYSFVTPPDPNVSVVSLDDVKANARIDSTDDDSLLSIYIQAAEERIEQLTGRLLRPATILGEYPYEAFSRFEQHPYLELERNPVRSVTTVEVHDGDSFVALDTEDFAVEKKAGYWRVQLYPLRKVYSLVNSDDVPYPIRVTFDAGYLDGDVPVKLRLAIMQYATWLYENRGDCSEEDLPQALKSVINSCRILRVFA